MFLCAHLQEEYCKSAQSDTLVGKTTDEHFRNDLFPIPFAHPFKVKFFSGKHLEEFEVISVISEFIENISMYLWDHSSRK